MKWYKHKIIFIKINTQYLPPKCSGVQVYSRKNRTWRYSSKVQVPENSKVKYLSKWIWLHSIAANDDPNISLKGPHKNNDSIA